jgi:hypothetical protein
MIQSGLIPGPAETSGGAVGSNDLTSAIMQLLPAVKEVVAIHRADDADSGGCHCAFADPRLFQSGLATTAALDLIIRCWRLTSRSGTVRASGPRLAIFGSQWRVVGLPTPESPG